jgi:hypothetical protein
MTHTISFNINYAKSILIATSNTTALEMAMTLLKDANKDLLILIRKKNAEDDVNKVIKINN